MARSKLRVMLVESHNYQDDGYTLAAYLRRQGCSVDHLDAGWHAWQMMRITHYDVVIMDLRLRDISGLELLRLMRALDNGPLTILSMDDLMPPIQRIALNMGVAACYVKPLPPEKVFELILGVVKTGSQPDNQNERLAA